MEAFVSTKEPHTAQVEREKLWPPKYLSDISIRFRIENRKDIFIQHVIDVELDMVAVESFQKGLDRFLEEQRSNPGS